ncbi:MAG: DUF2085 domain-containing protein [Thermoplasmata archaeon]
MIPPPVEPSQSPEWEILLAHHGPERFHRTYRLPWGNPSLHVCARCTGELIGIAGFLALLGATLARLIPLFDPPVQLLFALAPFPAALDWVTQSLGRRESTNHVRLFSGALLGASFADLLALAITGRWLLLLGGIVVAGLYVGAIGFVLFHTGAWRRVLEEHFPGAGRDGSAPEILP